MKATVLVRKAILKIMSGEKIHDVLNALSKSGSKYVLDLAKLSNGKGYSWMCEAYGDKAVFAVQKRSTKEGEVEQVKFVSVTYKRKDGEFEFSNPTEVERETVWKPAGGGMYEYVRKAKWKPVSKPYPNEHAARQTDPKKYKKFARGVPSGFPEGISVIYGIFSVGGKDKSEIQSIRFDASKWTEAKAKKWLKDHDFKTVLEAAAKTKKGLWKGIV